MNLEERAQHFRQVLEKHPGTYHIVMTQVDPDALASGFAMAFVLRELGVEAVRIYTCGGIGHPQNRVIVNRYNLTREMISLSEGDDSQELPQGEDDRLVLVDSSSVMDNRVPTEIEREPLIVVDHHRGSELQQEEDNFIWIEDVGSTATLMNELMGALDIEVPSEHRHINVLLALGIYTDTKALISANERDREAYGRLTSAIPNPELAAFINYPLPESHFQHLRYALTHMEREGSRLIANAGHLRSEHGDDLSTIADYLLRMDGISLVVVWGIVNGHVRISARNQDLSTPLDDFLRKRFGVRSGAKLAPDGRGEGGARIELELGFWMGADTQEEIEALVSKKLNAVIFSD